MTSRLRHVARPWRQNTWGASLHKPICSRGLFFATGTRLLPRTVVAHQRLGCWLQVYVAEIICIASSITHTRAHAHARPHPKHTHTHTHTHTYTRTNPYIYIYIYIYIYVYTRIFARASRALDSLSPALTWTIQLWLGSTRQAARDDTPHVKVKSFSCLSHIHSSLHTTQNETIAKQFVNVVPFHLMKRLLVDARCIPRRTQNSTYTHAHMHTHTNIFVQTMQRAS